MTKNSFALDKFEITAKDEMASDTSLLTLKGRLDFTPGQFIIVEDDHFGESAYAPCSDPKEKKSFQICIRSCGSTSDSLSKLLPGETVKLRGPYGNGWPREDIKDKDVVLIAGGMGLVPLRPLVLEYISGKLKFHSLKLFAGFKSSSHLLFEKDLGNWRKKYDVKVAVEYIANDFWGEKGLITEILSNAHFGQARTVFLLCGPEVMIGPIVEVLLTKKIQKNQIYISYERRMECGIGVCQHCNIGKFLVCQDGPIFRLDQIESELEK